MKYLHLYQNENVSTTISVLPNSNTIQFHAHWKIDPENTDDSIGIVVNMDKQDAVELAHGIENWIADCKVQIGRYCKQGNKALYFTGQIEKLLMNFEIIQRQGFGSEDSSSKTVLSILVWLSPSDAKLFVNFIDKWVKEND